MDGHTFISWNLPNLVTVILMGAVGLILYKGIKGLVQKAKGG